MTYERITKIADTWLPKPRILHPWPDGRFAVTIQGGAQCPSCARRDLCGECPNGYSYLDHTPQTRLNAQADDAM